MPAEIATLKTVESPAKRAARHLVEAEKAATEQVELLLNQMFALHGVARAIVEGGPIYPAGVRDLCTRLLTEVETKAKTVDSVLQKID
jgi:hypothetical protein